MKTKAVLLLSIVLTVMIYGCAQNQPSGAGSQSAAATIAANATTTVEQRGITCPTTNEDARTAYNNGVNLQQQGNIDAAVGHFQQAIELDPNFCDAMDNLGQILRSQGKIDEAIEWYKKSIEVAPNNTVARQNLAFAYQTQGQIENAIAEYQKIIEIDPNEAEGYYGLGNLYLNLNRPQEAIPLLQQAESLYEKDSSPFLSDARFSLGVAHYITKDSEKARDYFESIYTGMETNPYLNYYLGLCYLSPEIKDLEAAKRYIAKAQELGVQVPAEVLNQVGQ